MTQFTIWALDTLSKNDSSVQKFLDRISQNKSEFDFTGWSFVNLMHKVVKFSDWFGVFMVIFGILLIFTSLLGNNGRRKLGGVSFIFAGYMAFIFPHVLMTIYPAYGNLGQNKWLVVIAMLLSQTMLFVGATGSFLLGVQSYELYEISELPSLDRKKDTAFSTMKWIIYAALILCAFSILVGGID